jgi:hypothetical protein
MYLIHSAETLKTFDTLSRRTGRCGGDDRLALCGIEKDSGLAALLQVVGERS